MKIIEVTIDDVLQAIQPLFVAHREELTTNKELMQLNPDIETYRKLEASKVLLALAVYMDDVLAGYSITFISPHLHYKDLICAHNDLLFLQKQYRNGKVGLALMQETERLAKERGAKMILWHAKNDTPLAKLLPLRGFVVQDIIFSKEL